ncbi:MAG TPA: PEP/pyruvate-binding domain-containing protein [Chloroflexota bacterium]|nr:PEP/pyruvate-binding domain-containing protein [Chloroflexota bacterium]
MTGASAAQVTAEAVVWLDGKIIEEPLEQLGGKARSLVQLIRAGLGERVPAGFVVPAEMEAGDALTETVGRAYAALAERVGEQEPLVAVRSSCTAEDLAEASFAGQYETYLGVRGAAEVAARVGDCRRSLESQRVAAYAARVGSAAKAGATNGARSAGGPRMAVLVQRLVDATAAGVAYTADPITGERERVRVSAAWGLGQAVVDGEVSPDEWWVERKSLRLAEQRAGHKPVRRRAAPGAPQEAVPVEEQDRLCLSDELVQEVARLALDAEKAIGAAADVEWAMAGGRVWLLQARPITALPATTTPASEAAESQSPAEHPERPAPARVDSAPDFPFVWPSKDDATRHWVQGAVDGRVNEVMPPLELDVRERWARTFEHASHVAGWSAEPARIIEVNGRQYWHYPPRDPNAPPDPHRDQVSKTFERWGEQLCERGETFLDAVTFPEMKEGDWKLAAVEPDALPPAELAAHLTAALDWLERGWTLHWARPKANPAERFTRIYSQLTGEKGRPAMEAARMILSYEPNKMTEAVDGLVALARIVQRHGPLRAWLSAREPEEAVISLNELADVSGGDAFRRELDDLLTPQRQGLRCGASWGVEQNQCLPGWRDTPQLVLALVMKYVPLDLDGLERSRAETLSRRDARAAELRAKAADDETRRQFDFWLAAGRQAVRAQEDHNYYIDSATMSLAHRAIMACGRRLAAAGALEDEEDVWWMREFQVTAAVNGLPEQVGVWRKLVAANKALADWQSTLKAPETLGAPPRAADQKAAADMATPRKPESQPLADPEPETLLVKGQRAAVGRRTGRVRIVHHNAPDAEMPAAGPDDVLVARKAGALWGPLAPAVAAVVLEMGSPFMHVMAVCREYGVPGIVNAGGALEKLRDGQRVTVDAERGWVLSAE